MLVGTFLINHFDLFGLRQVYLYHRAQEYTDLGFGTPFLYKVVRHPIMLGFIIAFWSTPRMTLGHLVFAIATTAYILIAIQIEERDIVNVHGVEFAIAGVKCICPLQHNLIDARFYTVKLSVN